MAEVGLHLLPGLAQYYRQLDQALVNLSSSVEEKVQKAAASTNRYSLV